MQEDVCFIRCSYSKDYTKANIVCCLQKDEVKKDQQHPGQRSKFDPTDWTDFVDEEPETVQPLRCFTEKSLLLFYLNVPTLIRLSLVLSCIYTNIFIVAPAGNELNKLAN